ncbi:acetate--CoA ligase family protein [Aeromicrobium yanjiei]|uniref:CoA-binding protein n=1 Tax=Aeromicrobium yanjiei TaxID=2662028 RepID=A0A5Q2MCP4_9ACTN|nr:acetate--CoA ligase family protein [Aeromicrobium yanjiei]QGG40338.1 CoA-binding protein [Aeromicrobium yanjiei]
MTTTGTPLITSSTDALDSLFSPQAIAIVGASGRQSNLFARPLQYLTAFGYKGAIYPINPGYESLHGVACYPDVDALPGPIDLALVLIPAARAISLLPAIARAGAKVAVIFASGFSETGEEGQALQTKLTSVAAQHGIRLIGPNCQGALNTATHFYGTFTGALEVGPLTPGGLTYVGQSGAVGGSILSLARERGIGIASWISTGNQADLKTVEIARYLIEQDATTTLAMYIESATGEREFLDLATRAQELGKSLIVLRSATSEAGARAAASHTGAIVGSAAAFNAVVREYGVVLADDIDELVELAHVHTTLPRAHGPAVAIVTTSGGVGSLAADLADSRGLDVVQLSEQAQNELAAMIPAYGATENPIDVTAQVFNGKDVTEFISVCKLTAALPEVDVVLVALTLIIGDQAEKAATALAGLIALSDKPIVVAWCAAHAQTTAARHALRDAGFPVFDSVGSATLALRSLVSDNSTITPNAPSTPTTADDFAALIDQYVEVVTEAAAAPLMDGLGIPRPTTHLITDLQQAEDLAATRSTPAVLKIQSPNVLHKTDRGGVLVGIEPADLPRRTAQLLAMFAGDQPEGVLIQDLVGDGIELIVGVTRSGDHGLPLITVGLGGTATELYRDTATTFAPVDRKQAKTLLLRTRAAALLTGYRSTPAYDLDAVAEAIAQISQLAVVAGDRLREVEVNPLRVTHDPHRPVQALDFMMILAPKAGA